MRNLRRSTKRKLGLALSIVLVITVSVPAFYAYSPDEGREVGPVESIQREVSNLFPIADDREGTSAVMEREGFNTALDIDRNGSESVSEHNGPEATLPSEHNETELISENNGSETELASEHNRPETESATEQGSEYKGPESDLTSEYKGPESDLTSEQNGSETEQAPEYNVYETTPTEPEAAPDSEYKQDDTITENRDNTYSDIAGTYVIFATEGDLVIDRVDLGYETDAMILLQGVTATDELGEDITHLIKVHDDGGFMDFVLANNEEGFDGQVTYSVQHPGNDEIFLSGPRNVYVASDAIISFGFGSLPVLILDMYALEEAIKNAEDDVTLVLDEEFIISDSFDMSYWTTHTITIYPVNSLVRHFYVDGPATLDFGGNVILDGMSVGGGIATNSSGNFDISISNVTIRNCFAQHGGGIDHRGQGTLFIENSVIEDNQALFYGGGIISMHENGAVVIGDNVKIIGNNSSGSGGGIASSSQIMLSGNVLIEDNHAVGVSGGGIYISDISGVVTIKDGVRIVDNTSELHGGGIFSVASLSIEGDVLIENNHSRNGDGGGIFLDFHAQTTITDGARILNNRAESGGGIATLGMLEISGDGTAISGNHALVGSGGGILTYNAIEIRGDVLIENNQSKNGSGGGLYATGGHLVTIEDGVKIIGNTAHENGGGISTFGATTISGNVLIEGNHASLHNGGGVHNVNILSQIIVEDGVRFINNTAGTHGGAIFTFSSLSIMDDVLIEGNEAINGRGGGTYSYGSTTIEDNVTITDNDAGDNGGGIHVAGSGSLTVLKDDVKIIGNSTHSGGGGGISVQGFLEISGVGIIISGNNALQGGGGGIRAFRTIEISGDVLIEENHAAFNGGGVSSIGNVLVSIKCGVRIIGNTAGISGSGGGGGGISANGPLDISGDGIIIRENRAGVGGGGIMSASTLEISGDVLIQGNSAENGGGGGIFAIGNTQISGDVRMINNRSNPVGGGAIRSAGQLEISGDVLIEDNRTLTGPGGALDLLGPTSISGNVKIVGNIARSHGGGITAFNQLEISGDVLIEGNRAETGHGGGIYSHHPLTIKDNVKIINNSTSQGNGGGINFNFNGVTNLDIGNNVTFQGNEARRAFNYGRLLGITAYPNINWLNENSLQGRMDSGEPHLLNNYDLSYTVAGSSWALEFVRIPDNVDYGMRQVGNWSLFGLRDQVARDALASDVDADFDMGPANWDFGFEIYNTRSADWSLWLECTPFFKVNNDGTLDTDISAAVPFAVDNSNTAKDLTIGGVRVFDSTAVSVTNGNYILWHWTELFYDIELGALPTNFDGEFQSEFTWTLSGQLP